MFYLFDNDKGGTLDFREIKSMLETIHGDITSNAKISSLMEKLAETSYISVGQFSQLCRKERTLTNPLLVQQLKLQKDLIGEKFWIELCAKRKEHPYMLHPDFVLKLSERADAEYKAIARKQEQEQRLNEMRENVNNKAAAVRPNDQRTQRRNSLILGLMNLKGAATSDKKPDRGGKKLDVNKYLDNNDLDAELNLENQQKRGRKSIKTDLNSVLADDGPSYVQGVDEATDVKKENKRSRKTMVAKGSSKSDKHEESNAGESSKSKKHSSKGPDSLPPVKQHAKFKPH